MKRLRNIVALSLLALSSLAVFGSTPASAEASLQVNPQKYEDTLLGSQVRNGFVDVSNPGDATVTIQSYVEGFRQADLDGNLEFFKDDTLSAAIKPGLATFDLGPRQAIRVTFTVDPGKLPKGGIYAAIFFKTIPPHLTSSVSYIAESANVGTLLILQNGAIGTHTGEIKTFSMPFLQLGGGIGGSASYTNTNRDVTAVAFQPQLTTQVTPWGKAAKLTGPLILPLSTRQFDVMRKGSYLGLLPVTLADTGSGKAQTRWILAMTGWYGFVIPLIFVLIILDLFQAWIRRRRKTKEAPEKRTLDGLTIKPKK